MSALRISIGADPELWLRDPDTGLIVSAHDRMPGTKLEPHPVNLGAVQVDGVAAEFNIEPTYDAEHFVKYIHAVKGQIKGFVGGLQLVEEPIALFEPGYFKALPEHVRLLGCNPDWNAWTGQVNEKPDDDMYFDGKLMRTAAGHIHIGGWCKNTPANLTDKTHFDDCRIIAKQLDYYLGMNSLMWDDDHRRRKMYGMAGSFRPKPYGMEYRPLSNVWLRSPKLQTWLWNACYQAVWKCVQEGQQMEDKFSDLARKVIDGNEKWWEDKNTATQVREWTGLSLPPKIEVEKPKEATSEDIKELYKKGMKKTRKRAQYRYQDFSGVIPALGQLNGAAGSFMDDEGIHTIPNLTEIQN